MNDGTPERRGSVPSEGMDWARVEDLPDDQKPAPYMKDWSASGLAGVWADENTREAIYAALRASVPPVPGKPKTIQERAWSSPVWYDAAR